MTTIKSIDWNYTQLDPNQIWAEAFVAYASGESWYLTKEEREQSEENNQVYRVPNPIDGYLSKYFDIDATETDPNVWTSTADIVDRLIAMGYKGSSTRSIAMEVAATLGEMGVTKVRKWRGNSGVWGYQGVQPILSTVPPTNQP